MRIDCEPFFPSSNLTKNYRISSSATVSEREKKRNKTKFNCYYTGSSLRFHPFMQLLKYSVFIEKIIFSPNLQTKYMKFVSVQLCLTGERNKPLKYRLCSIFAVELINAHMPSQLIKLGHFQLLKLLLTITSF